jgi:hypothetical protein
MSVSKTALTAAAMLPHQAAVMERMVVASYLFLASSYAAVVVLTVVLQSVNRDVMMPLS